MITVSSCDACIKMDKRKHLQAVLREHPAMPVVEELLHRMLPPHSGPGALLARTFDNHLRFIDLPTWLNLSFEVGDSKW
jgi:hypothetical protein